MHINQARSFDMRLLYWLQKKPHSIAIQMDSRQVTYCELDSYTTHLAIHIQEQVPILKPTIAIYLPRGTNHIIAAVGIIKAGGTYMPLDVDAPTSRLETQLATSNTSAIIVDSRTDITKLRKLGQTIKTIIIDDFLNTSNDYSKAVVKQTKNPIACILFTSGSTGMSKGVKIRKTNIINLTVNSNYAALSDKDIICHACDTTFDISLFDIWGTLLNGAKMVILRNKAEIDSKYFATILKKNKVTTIFMATAIFHQWVNINPYTFNNVIKILIGGEKANSKIIKAFFQAFESKNISAPVVVNTYGPTENTTNSTYFSMLSSKDVNDEIPIGKPVSGVKIHLLDDKKNTVSSGETGEIYLSGKSLSAGYLQKDKNCAFQKIVIDNKLTRVYQTGDVARVGNDGLLYYIGRTDFQFKRQGKRIHPSEIETAILQYPILQQALVVSQLTPATLVHAYITLKKHSENFSEEALRAYLTATLPAHMLPNTITVLETFPLTARGKIDRSRLPKPSKNASLIEKTSMSHEESILMSLWCYFLGLDLVNKNENFFSLGGDSIIAIQIAGHARQHGVFFNPVHIFEYPTIQLLATQCKARSITENESNTQLPDHIELMPIQRWFFNQSLANVHHMNQSYLIHIMSDLNVDLLNAALQHYIDIQCVMHFRWHQRNHQWQIRKDEPRRVKIQTIVLNSHPLHCPQGQQHIRQSEGSLNITDGTFIRVTLFNDQKTKNAWLHLSMHHIVSDGISWRVMLEAIQHYYEQLQNGKALPLMQNHTYAFWSNHMAQHHMSVPAEAMQYWKNYHIPSRDTLLKLWLSALPASGQQVARIRFSLNSTQTHKMLHQCVSETDVTINALILTALYIAWYQVSGESLFSVVCEGHGRELANTHPAEYDLSDSHGWFTILYPLTLDWLDQFAKDDWLANVLKLNTILHQIPNRGFDYLPLLYNCFNEKLQHDFSSIPIKFNYLGQFQYTEKKLQLSSDKIIWQKDENNCVTHAMDIECAVMGDVFHAEMIYSDEIDAGKAAEWMQSFEVSLNAMITSLADSADNERANTSCVNVLTDKSLPLSTLQQGLYTHCIISDDPLLYTTETLLTLTGELNVEDIKSHWENIVTRNDFFRAVLTTADKNDKRISQLILPKIDLPWLFVDVSDMQAHNQQDYIRQYLDEELMHISPRPHRILFRILFFKLNQNTHQLAWLHHHIFIDGWTLNEVLSSFVSDFLSMEDRSFHGLPAIAHVSDEAEAKQFWIDYLSPITYEQTPKFVITSRKEVPTKKNHAKYTLAIDKNMMKAIKKFAQEQSVSVNSIFQVAWSLLLCYYTDEKAICHGTTLNLKNDNESRGMAINTVPICFDWQHNRCTTDYIHDMHHTVKKLLHYGALPLSDILKQNHKMLDSSLFNTLLVMEDYIGITRHNEHFEVTQLEINEYNHYAITCFVKHQETLCFLYNENHLPSPHIDAFGRRFLLLLQQLCKPTLLENIQFLLPDEILCYQAINQTHQNFDCQRAFPAAFSQYAQQRANNIALIYGDKTLSYGELDIKSNNVAHQLLASGITTGQIIPLCCERSFELIISLVGILKAGCAYLPIDKSWPSKRIQQILDNSSATTIVLDDRCALAHVNTDKLETYSCSKLQELCLSDNVLPDINPDSLAYVMYTSGSTGTPKGVMIQHCSLMERLHWMQHQYSLLHGEMVLLKTPYTFDVSAWELFWPMLFGGTLLISEPDMHKDPYYLIQTLTQHPVAYVHFVPSMLDSLLDACHGVLKTQLKRVICIGEEVKPSLVDKFYQHFTCPLENLYGPTEASIIATRWVCENHLFMKKIPIGYPISNVQCHVLSKHGYLYPPEMLGELYLSGTGLATGYVNQPTVTQHVFFKQRLLDETKMVYRTGDQCIWNAEYGLVYMGRNDTEVKLHGNRFDLVEIENALLQAPLIAQAIVDVDPSSQQLAAFVVLKDQSDRKPNEALTTILQKHLHDYLPAFAVPSFFMVFDRLPLLTNGKVDRKQLRTVRSQHIAQTESTQRDKDDCHINAVQDILSDFAQGELIVRHQPLVSYGLSSFQLVGLLVRLNNTFETRLTLNDLHGNLTLQHITDLVRTQKPTLHQCVIPIKASGNDVPLVLIHAIGGTVFCFYELGDAFEKNRPLYAMQDLGLSDPRMHFANLESMATHYLSELTATFKSNRFILGGLSFGANLAVEMASQLDTDYQYPVVLLDGWASYPDAVHRKKHLIPYLNMYFSKVEQFTDKKSMIIPDSFLSIHRERAQYLLDYKTKPIWHDLLLLKAVTTSAPLKSIDAADNHWGSYAKAKLDIILTPGDHETLLIGKNAQKLADTLAQALKTATTQEAQLSKC